VDERDGDPHPASISNYSSAARARDGRAADRTERARERSALRRRNIEEGK